MYPDKAPTRTIKTAADRTPEERGIIALFFRWIDNPLDLHERDRFIDRIIEWELKNKIKAQPNPEGLK